MVLLIYKDCVIDSWPSANRFNVFPKPLLFYLTPQPSAWPFSGPRFAYYLVISASASCENLTLMRYMW